MKAFICFFRKIICVLLACAVACPCIILMSGCSSEDNGASYNIYYKNSTSNKLITSSYNSDNQDTYELAGELLSQMIKKPKDKDTQILLPAEVSVDRYEINSNTINVYFSREYNEMSDLDELFLRAGVVKMLTQLPEISYVQFYVDDVQAKYSNGSYIGLMSSEDFIDDSNASFGNVEWRRVNLYFSNKLGDKLVKKTETVAYSKSTSLEKIVVEQLIKGPSDSSMNMTLPSDLKLLSISVSDKICYVNLSSVFLTEMVNVTSELPIYSIVNSLCSLGNIDGVRIMVNGDSTKNFRESISLENTFQFNSEVIGS